MQDEGYYAVILLSEEENENIVKPFLNGKFSEMSKDLINSYPKLVDTGKVHTLRGSMRKVLGFSLQKKICTKSRDLREFWENYLDVTLPQDAEVWSKPELKDEYYQADEAFHESDQDDGERPGSSTTPTDE